jgi:hypothetical protein
MTNLCRQFVNAVGCGTRIPTARLWGDGVADQPYTALLTATSWCDASNDELAYLIPGLVRARRNGDSRALGQVLTNKLIARLWLAARYIGWSEGQAIVSGAFARRSGALEPQFDLAAARSMGGTAAADYLGLSCLTAADWQPVPSRPWMADRRALELIAGMTADASTSGTLQTAVTLSEALECSIHTGVNAAYIYPSYAFAHELLLSGAWLGELQRGRRALMPQAVADCIASYLQAGRTSADGDGKAPEPAHVLARVGQEAVGNRKLLKAAATVQKTGVAIEMRPRTIVSAAGAERWRWN